MLAQIKILLVDDLELIRSGLRQLIEKDPMIKIIAEASSGEQALKLAKEKKPNIILMDIKMPGIGGLAAINRLTKSVPHIKIIALTAYTEGFYPEQILNNQRARGLLSKGISSTELLEAIHKVHEGEIYIGTKIAQQLAIRRLTLQQGDLSEEEAIIKGLAPREFEVFCMIGHGYTINDIGKKLNITGKTINTYRYRIFKKLGIKNDVQLAHVALRNKIIEIDASSEMQ